MKTMFFTIALLFSAGACAGAPEMLTHAGHAMSLDPLSSVLAALAVGGTIQVLRDQRTGLVGKMRSLLNAATEANRDLTAEEQKTYDGMDADQKSLATQIRRSEELESVEAELDQKKPAVASRQAPTRGAEAKKDFDSFGEFMYAVRFKPEDQRLSWQENPALKAEQNMEDGASGGFMVPKQFSTEIMQVDAQEAIVRPRATVIPAGTPPDSSYTIPALDQTGTVPGNVYGGVVVNWLEEGGTKEETDAKFRQIELKPHEVAGTITVTDKLLRNWTAAGPFLQGLLRGAVTQSSEDAYVNGNGVGKPRGYIGSGAAYLVTRTTPNLVKYADIVEMLARLMGANGVWSGNRSILPQLMKLTDDDGRLIWQPSAREGEPDRLLGKPMLWNQRNPTLGTKGDLTLADFSHYLIKDGSGPFVAASEHVKFTQNKTVIKIFWNVDASPWLTAPFKQEKGYEVSPFVVLKA